VGLKTKQFTIKKKLVVLTEVISAESGIKPSEMRFLWEGHNVQDVATPKDGTKPALVLDFYNQTKNSKKSKPNHQIFG
jgi:hypothetical protein